MDDCYVFVAGALYEYRNHCGSCVRERIGEMIQLIHSDRELQVAIDEAFAAAEERAKQREADHA